MTEIIHRLWQILGVIEKEGRTLQAVMQRLFPGQGAVTPQWLESLLATPEGIARLESFVVGKFSRMQDTLVDKLLPHFLLAVGEEPGTALDNLRRVERLGMVSDPDQWLAITAWFTNMSMTRPNWLPRWKRHARPPVSFTRLLMAYEAMPRETCRQATIRNGIKGASININP